MVSEILMNVTSGKMLCKEIIKNMLKRKEIISAEMKENKETGMLDIYITFNKPINYINVQLKV